MLCYWKPIAVTFIILLIFRLLYDKMSVFTVIMSIFCEGVSFILFKLPIIFVCFDIKVLPIKVVIQWSFHSKLSSFPIHQVLSRFYFVQLKKYVKYQFPQFFCHSCCQNHLTLKVGFCFHLLFHWDRSDSQMTLRCYFLILDRVQLW